MAYRKDQDLEFLSKCNSKDLEPIYDILTKNKDGVERFSELLTTNEIVRSKYPNHSAYWDLIAEEIQLFGGNTLINAVREGGILYKEILIDVSKKMKVKFNSEWKTEAIENELLLKVLTDSVEKMQQKELKELVDGLKVETGDMTKQGVVAALQAGINAGGFGAYKLAAIVANGGAKLILGHGLPFAANAGLMKGVAVLSGPIGLAISAAWTIIGLSGPAYRVTIPVVIHLSYLRTKMKYERERRMKIFKMVGVAMVLVGIIWAILHYMV